MSFSLNMTMLLPCRHRQNGFTLIELVIVMVLMSIMLTLAIPSMNETLLTDQLSNGARQLIGTVKSLRNTAVREQQPYLLYINTDERRIWFKEESEEKSADNEVMDEEYEESLQGFLLSPTVTIQDVWTRADGINESELITLRISKQGYMDETVVHLTDDKGETISLFFYSFMDSVKIHDGYVNPES